MTRLADQWHASTRRATSRPLRRRRTWGVAAGVALVAALAAASPPAAGAAAVRGASASACDSRTSGPPVSPGTVRNELFGVAVPGRCDAWAVGSDSSGGADQTLIEHWNGTTWTQVPSPDPGTAGNDLVSVRAVSPTSIWAVGSCSNGAGDKTLILHWNGTRWRRVPSPSPGTTSALSSVRPVSPTSVWAVGFYSDGTRDNTLILHWNGTRWRRVPSPSPGTGDVLASVAVTSARDAWAVGTSGDIANSANVPAAGAATPSTRTLILHWNGTRWKRVPSPNRGVLNLLRGVGARSAASAWAVGVSSKGTGEQTLVLHWNGTTWKRVASPNLGGMTAENLLTGVTALSARSAWAVGEAVIGTGSQTLILHWNGTTWKRVPSPNPGDTAHRNFFDAVAVRSPFNAWAVGTFDNGSADQALAVPCC